MHNRAYQQLKELSWRRRLSPVEQEQLNDYLSAHPEARQEWEQDLRLNRCLAQLPDVPVSSNFTARVLQAARRAPEQKTRWFSRLTMPLWLTARWVPRGATGALILLLGSALFLHQYHQNANARMARDLVEVNPVATLPEIEWMKDYETIERLTRVQIADSELLTVLR